MRKEFRAPIILYHRYIAAGCASLAFETFFGGSMTYNQSNRDPFSYLKPTAYVGIAAYFGLL